MGFGSYDESEQQNQEINAEDTEGVTVHENEHDGELTFESHTSTDDLLNQLETIKSTTEE